MARQAVSEGDHVAVVAALESTLQPTLELLHEEARRIGRRPELEPRPCLHAWAHWEAGDIAGYHRAIAEHVDALDGSFDTVVLAQASMLGASPLISRQGLVIASPPVALAEAVGRLAPH
jgi:hypothetical protein